VEESVRKDEPVLQEAGDGTGRKLRRAFGNKELKVEDT
jgi:hypothetical protein